MGESPMKLFVNGAFTHFARWSSAQDTLKCSEGGQSPHMPLFAGICTFRTERPFLQAPSVHLVQSHEFKRSAPGCPCDLLGTDGNSRHWNIRYIFTHDIA